MEQVVLVCGGRDYFDRRALCQVLDAAHYANPIKRLRAQVFLADWKHNGKAAGPLRNQRMLDEGKPDIVIAFPGGRGTADMVKRAEAARVPVLLCKSGRGW